MDIRFEMEKLVIEREEMRRARDHMAQRRRQELCDKQVHPANEAAKRALLVKYEAEINAMTEEINRKAVEIYNLKRRLYP